MAPPVQSRHRVSIALATYNGARFLPEQVASYLAQSRLPDELVVGDDGSTDDTLTLLEDFAARAPFPVRITRNVKNLGPCHNFVETMRRCTGQIVLLSDQDDVWHKDKIARMLAHMEGNPGSWLATHNAALVDEQGAGLGVTMGGQIAKASGGLAARDLVAGCCMAIDARLLTLFDPVPRLRQHDAWLAYAADLLGLRSYLAAPLIDYRRHGANVSQSYMSAIGRVSVWTRLRDRAGKAFAEPAGDALAWAVAGRQDMVAAFRRHAAILAQVVPEERLERVIANEEAALQDQLRRLAIHRAPLWQRPGKLAVALLCGTYRGKQGLFSLLRDLRDLLRSHGAARP